MTDFLSHIPISLEPYLENEFEYFKFLFGLLISIIENFDELQKSCIEISKDFFESLFFVLC